MYAIKWVKYSIIIACVNTWNSKILWHPWFGRQSTNSTFQSTNAFVQEGHPIITPPGCKNLHQEVELGVIIGKTAKVREFLFSLISMLLTSAYFPFVWGKARVMKLIWCSTITQFSSFWGRDLSLDTLIQKPCFNSYWLCCLEKLFFSYYEQIKCMYLPEKFYFLSFSNI